MAEPTSERPPTHPPGDAVPAPSAMTEPLSDGADFISSVVAGLLLGLAIDWLAGTGPWFTIAGVILGFVSGFLKLWRTSAVLEDMAERRRRGV